MKIVISDRPVEIPEEDILGRSPFAKSIADQIIHTPDKGSLRIGIYGGWGEGKTSILRLIANELEKNGHVCIWVTPWVFSDRGEILEYLIHDYTEKSPFSAATSK
jgi:predicted KAP-like P-loop ATPase